MFGYEIANPNPQTPQTKPSTQNPKFEFPPTSLLPNGGRFVPRTQNVKLRKVVHQKIHSTEQVARPQHVFPRRAGAPMTCARSAYAESFDVNRELLSVHKILHQFGYFWRKKSFFRKLTGIVDNDVPECSLTSPKRDRVWFQQGVGYHLVVPRSHNLVLFHAGLCQPVFSPKSTDLYRTPSVST